MNTTKESRVVKLFDLTGKTYNGLKVIERVGKYSSGDSKWSYLCHCGEVKTSTGSTLRLNKIKSCGCMKNKYISEKNKTHGESKNPLYTVLKTMIARCNNTNNHKYSRYGARGIRVCDEWLDYENFRDWALSNGYKSGLTIDRIDNDGNYSPSNCRWVDNKTQSRNKSTNRFLEYKGVKKILSDWSKLTGLNHKTIAYRIDKGWSVELALTTPTKNIIPKNIVFEEIVDTPSVHDTGGVRL